MAAKHYREIFSQTLEQEAGFQQMRNDPGNYCGGKLIGTKYGVGAQAYAAVYKACPTVAAMKNLTVAQAALIWKKTVWDNIRGDEISSAGICAMLLYAIGGGKSGYLSMRQTINLVAGKKIVAETTAMKITDTELDFINNNSFSFFNTFYKVRLDFFTNHKNKAFVKGWIKRLNKIYNAYKDTVEKPNLKLTEFAPWSL